MEPKESVKEIVNRFIKKHEKAVLVLSKY